MINAVPYVKPKERPPVGYDSLWIGTKYPGGPIIIQANAGDWRYQETWDHIDWADRQKEIIDMFRRSAIESLKHKHG